MKNKTVRKGRPRWVARRVTAAFSEEQGTKLDELVTISLKDNPMASQTTVMHEALETLYKLKTQS